MTVAQIIKKAGIRNQERKKETTLHTNSVVSMRSVKGEKFVFNAKRQQQPQ